MDFLYLLRVLMKRKWIIIGSAILAAVLAYFLTQNEPKKYNSSAQISTGYAIKEIVSINPDFDPLAAETKFNNAIATFTSDPVLILLSYELILHDLNSPVPFRKLDDADKQLPEYKNVNLDEARQMFQSRLDSMNMLTSFKPDERKLLELLKLYGYDYKSIMKKLAVYRLQRTDYLKIDFTSENPELSAFVVNNLYQQFQRYTSAINKERGTESVDTLKSVMDRRKQEVDYKNAILNKLGYTEEGMSVSTIEVAGELRTRMQEEKSKKTQKEYE